MKIVVLAIHGLGANWLGCYGNEWVATPNLDRLAAEGTVYDNCYVEQPGTVPTLNATVIPAKKAGGPPLASVRAEFASRTFRDDIILIESDAFLPPWHVPAELFEDYYEEGEAAMVVSPRDGDEWQAVHSSFAAAVTMFDAEVGALMEMLPDATWIVVGTGGNALGEHGDLGMNLHEETIHVPLIVRRPDRATERIAGLVTIADLPAILDAVTTGRDISNIDRPHIISSFAGRTAIRTRDWTLLDGDTPQLYERPGDRREVYDVARMHPEVVDALLARK